VRVSEVVSELEPCFSASAPVASVSACTEVVSVERSVPMVLSAVFCASNEVSCAFQGVSSPD